MEDQSHKESNFPLETSKLSNDDITTGSYGSFTWINTPSDADMWVSTPSGSGKNNRILHQKDFTTAYINWYRLYASQQTLQNSQKRKISERFAVLAKREDDWDERGSKKPTELILVYAERLIKELHDTITSAGHEWLTPFISSDEDGYITASWYREKRTLHIEIEENEAEYTKISGVKSNIKMEADSFDRNSYLTLWKWLLDEYK